MYATAHRVRNDDGLEAVHAFIHTHGEVPWAPDVSAWPESNPGELRLSKTTLPVGGHRVRSYLDVLAPDGTSLKTIQAALRQLRADLGERLNPTSYRAGSVTLRFGAERDLEPVKADELLSLASGVTDILERFNTLPESGAGASQ